MKNNVGCKMMWAYKYIYNNQYIYIYQDFIGFSWILTFFVNHHDST